MTTVGILNAIMPTENYDEVHYRVCDNDTDLKIVTGYVYVLPRGTGILISNTMDTYHVPLRFITEFKIKTGDHVITNVNGINVSNVSSVDHANFVDAKVTRPYRDTSICKFGQRVIVPYDDDFVEYIATQKDVQGIYSVALLLDEDQPSVEYLVDNNVNEVFLCRVEFDKKKRLLLVLSALLKAKQIVGVQKKDVVLYIDNMNKLFRIYNTASSPDPNTTDLHRVSNGCITDMKGFFTTARQIIDGGSLTIVCGMRNCTSDIEKFALSEITNICRII